MGAVGLSGLIALLVTEVTARGVPLVTDKTMIPYRPMAGDEAFAPRPSSTARTLKGITETTNRHGLRDPDRPLARSEDGPARIALLGDSVVWGYGLAAPDTIPRRLEVELAGAGVPAEAWTLAHPATNMSNHRARWARLGPQIDADVLLVFVVTNDLLPSATRFRITPQGLLSNPNRRAPYPDAVRPWLDRSAAFALSLRAVYAWEQMHEPALQHRADYLPILRRELGTILTQSPETPAAVVLVPGAGAPVSLYVRLAEGVGAEAARSGALFIDLRGVLGEPARADLLQPTDSTHPNAAGAERIVRAIAPVVPELLSETRSR